MTRGDHVIEKAAGKLETAVRRAQASGGVKGKVGAALAEDPDFLRKLKPSLIAARAKGETPAEPRPHAPSAAQFERPKRVKKRGGGPSPWLVVGLAVGAGYLLAKTIDWRAHAHPR
jgi:hypothetical protein